jgi:hypothetical protein
MEAEPEASTTPTPSPSMKNINTIYLLLLEIKYVNGQRATFHNARSKEEGTAHKCRWTRNSLTNGMECRVVTVLK